MQVRETMRQLLSLFAKWWPFGLANSPKKLALIDVPTGKWVNGYLLMLGDGKLGEPHGPQGSTMRPWSFEECDLKPHDQVTVSDAPHIRQWCGKERMMDGAIKL